MAKILLVEDDAQLAESLLEWLQLEKYDAELATDGSDALALLQSYTYDLVVLDWELPGLPGIDICRTFRRGGGHTPIIFLTGRTTMLDKESGFDAGGDDYLTKPFHIKELLARVRAMLRRPVQIRDEIIRIGKLELNAGNHKVFKDGQEVILPPLEYTLLELFMRNPDRVLVADAIIDRVWPSHDSGSGEALRTCLKRLREKIDIADQPSAIKNVRGIGYMMPKDQASS